MNKQLILILILFILIFSIGVSSANENINNTNLNDKMDNSNIINYSKVDNTPHFNNYRVNKIVNGSKFEDIQKTINSASDNDTLLLNGTYYGNGSQIIINKSITIQSNVNYTILDANYSSRIFYITADNVILNNLIIIHGKPDGYEKTLVDTIDKSPGAAIYWKGNNGNLVNSTIRDNYLQCINPSGKAIYWKGNNGTVINSLFVSNKCWDTSLGGNKNYIIIDGLVHGFYNGTLLDDTLLKNVSVNTNSILTFNNNIPYKNKLVFRLFDKNNIPYVNDTIKIHIFNNKLKYNNYFEVVVGSDGIVTLPLPSNLNVGNYIIEYYVKQISYCNCIGQHNTTLTFYYSDFLVKNSTLNIVKINLTLKSNSLNTYYKSGKHFNVKLIDRNGFYIIGLKLKFNVYSKNKLIKTYYRTTNSKGIAILKSNLENGIYIVRIYSTNHNYYIKLLKSTIKISKISTIIKAPKVANKYYKNSYFKVHILNKYDKKIVKGVTLKIKVYTGKKYKIYKVKTNSKGIVKLNTKYLKKGNHKVIISSANKNYVINKVSNIKIKK